MFLKPLVAQIASNMTQKPTGDIRSYIDHFQLYTIESY
jgi:hypothetical protein